MTEKKAPPPVRKSTVAATPKPRVPKVEARPAAADARPMRLVGWVAGVIVLLDQVLKYWVVHVMELDRVRAIDLFPPWLNLRMAWNEGVNFGLLSSEKDLMRWILIAVAVVICLWVWLWLMRSAQGRIARISGGLLIGGAIGNVIDRLYYGAVADFLNMSLPGWQNPYSFNLADIAIFAGAIGLILMPAANGAEQPDDKTRDEPRKSR
ncbi:MAG: signal peptidase II [Paracoccus sp. (in: a-proteobacteria)]